MTWWQSRDTLSRFVTDLIAGEMARLHPALRLADPPWPETLSMDEEGLGIDSLDRLAIANILASQLCIADVRAFDRFLQRRYFGEWLNAADAGLATAGRSIAFYSSGTMGERKRIVHALDALDEEIDFLASLVSPAGRIAYAVPSHHIYGFLFTILLPHRMARPVVDLRNCSPASYATLQAGDLVIAFPLLWQAAAEAEVHWSSGITGVTSTAPCPPELARKLRQAGLSRLIEIYGSTETTGIAWRDDVDKPFTLFPYWSRIAGDRIARHLRDDTLEYRLPDAPLWENDRQLRPNGRTDGQVQIGGVNVSPEMIRHVLLQHSSVGDAAVRLMRPEEGNRLKAFIVPTSMEIGSGELRHSLERWVRIRLTAPERPAAFTFGQELPRTSLGKPADWVME